MEKEIVDKSELIAKIKQLKKEKNAIILAHYYQIGEIQDLADYVGDSLGLAEQAQKTNADLIVFAGVHFMGETAKILNYNKKVVIPDMEAGCSLADSCNAKDLFEFKKKYPNHIVISYINCSAEVKALSDIICTSGNALQIINTLPADQKIIFAPDKNLGGYINRMSGRNMVLWDGVCEVHDILTAERVIKLKMENPDAKLLAHPECNAAVLELADFIGSTTRILKYVKTDDSKKYIVATETGIVHQMMKEAPNKEYIIVDKDGSCACNDCKYMKMNTLEKLYNCMLTEQPEILLSKELVEEAKKPIIKMLDISKSLGLI